MPLSEQILLTGQTLDFVADPGDPPEASAWRFDTEGALVIDQHGKIAWRGNRRELPTEFHALARIDYGSSLILPGFVDAHLHFPQYRMIGAPGRDLLDWLNRFAFVEELRFADEAFAQRAARRFLDELFRHGITSCSAFSTVHPGAVEALFQEAQSSGMQLISGKTLMDRNAPSGLLDTPQQGYDQTKTLIHRWHGTGRIQYAISPRFAVTSSIEQLEMVQSLLQEFPEMVLQTHLSENQMETRFVENDFRLGDYTGVYERYGFLRPKSLFAHGIHLTESELRRLAESGSAIVHCPTSNNFLGSGLFRYRASRMAFQARPPLGPIGPGSAGNHPALVGLGCDVGAGTSFSMLQTMRDAYIVSQLVGERINALEAFYLSSLGNARLLGLDEQIGSLQPGKYADLVVLDPEATPILRERHALSRDLEDVLFALMILGDDRAIRDTFVAGKKVKTCQESYRAFITAKQLNFS